MRRPCNQAGCPVLLERGSAYCPEHAREREAGRAERWPWRWVYRDPRWQRCRRRALERAGYRCEAVEDGERCTASDPTGRWLGGHHDYPGGVRAMLAAKLDPFDERYVRIACGRHHQLLEASERAAAATAAGRRR
jgi:hypothetical protein